MTILFYHCVGDVRRACDHKHRSAEAAARCMHEDQSRCRRVGGYSDRVVCARLADGADAAVDPDTYAYLLHGGQ